MADISDSSLEPSTSTSTSPTDITKASSSSRPQPTLSSLRAWLPLYLHRTDASLTVLSRMLSTPSGTDTILLLIGYSTLLTSTLLTRLSLARLRLISQHLIKQASTLPPDTTVLISVKNATIPTSTPLLFAKRLKALSALISDFRIFARLFGLVGIYQWGKSTWSNPPQDIVEARLVKAQVIVNLLFQILENGAYLASKNVLSWSEKKQNQAWLWSSRFWASHVFLEFARLGRVWVRQEKGDGEKGKEREGQWKREWARALLVNSAWAPLTLHWSTDGGLISDAWVGVFGSVAGVVGVGKLLRNSA